MKDTSNITPVAINNLLNTPVAVTVNKMLVNNALVTIYDALNGDDDDTRFEVSIVEQFIDQQAEQIEQLQTKLNDAAEVGMYQHYFATEMLKQLPENCLDLFNVGEDCFVMELYPYAELITKHVLLTLEDKEKEMQVIFAYEAMEELVGLWIATVMRQVILVTTVDTMKYEMPDLDQYELAVIEVVASHTQ